MLIPSFSDPHLSSQTRFSSGAVKKASVTVTGIITALVMGAGTCWGQAPAETMPKASNTGPTKMPSAATAPTVEKAPVAVAPPSKNTHVASADSEATTIHFAAVVAAARQRAKLLHEVYSSTLDVMHHRYFRHDHPVLPARTLEDVFEEMEATSGDKANWISVNTKAMSIDHEPATPFEKKAASVIARGSMDYEQIGTAIYQRAGTIRLRTSCVGCHTNMFSGAPTTPRFAALVITIQLKMGEADKADR